MSILDDLPAEIAEALADVFRDGVLIVPGERVSDGQGGWKPAGSPTLHACKLLVDDFADYRRQALGIPAADRKVIVLAASIEGGKKPAVGQKITAEGRDWQIVAVARDPAASTYELQAR